MKQQFIDMNFIMFLVYFATGMESLWFIDKNSGTLVGYFQKAK